MGEFECEQYTPLNPDFIKYMRLDFKGRKAYRIKHGTPQRYPPK